MRKHRLLFSILALVLVIVGVFWSRRDRGHAEQSDVAAHANGAAANPAAPAPEPPVLKKTTTSRMPADQGLAPIDQKRLQILEEDFQSGNDNDPRLDTDFRNLTTAAKAVLQAKYRSLPEERRNSRGTIVYLLGRELSSKQDLDFMQSVLQESPCLSLTDCKQVPPANVTANPENLGTDVTLAYPQIVAIKSLGRFLAQPSAASVNPSAMSAMKEASLQMLAQATRSDNPRIANAAKAIVGQ